MGNYFPPSASTWSVVALAVLLRGLAVVAQFLGRVSRASVLLFLVGIFTTVSVSAEDTGSRFQEGAIDYRLLELYRLVQNCRSGMCSKGFGHSQYDAHSVWWDPPVVLGSYSESYFHGVSHGLVSVATLLTVVAIAAGAIFLTTSVVWPYSGAASLTAIELPEASPWRITGYGTVHGHVVRYADLSEAARAFAADHDMFDPRRVPRGRFLLINQENWWGIIDYPVQVDVTFTHFDAGSNKASRKVKVNVRRKVTNGLKAGEIAAQVVSASGQDDQLIAVTTYPQWLDFSSWYHKPARVMIDFRQ